MIMTCTCKHKFQDNKYGKQKRVFNRLKGNEEARCTVCCKEKKI